MLYYSPEKEGLEPFAELHFSDEPYEFDFRVVWIDTATGKLLTARDSGCSCPSPFEDFKKSDLAEIDSIGWLQDEIRTEGRDVKPHEASDFISKIREYLSKRS